MSKNEIVEALGKDKVVEKIAAHYNTPYREDLCQYIYYYLLTGIDENKLNEIYENGQINYFIAGIIKNQIFSKHQQHYRNNVRHFDSINKENKDGKPYEEIIVAEEPREEIENKVDEYLGTLSERDKQMVWLLMYPTWERSDDINHICSKYNLSKFQYNRIIPKLKLNMGAALGFERPITKKEGKYNCTKVQMIDKKSGKVVKVYDSVGDVKKELIPKGFTQDGIYNCLCGSQKAHKGYTFRYLV